MQRNPNESYSVYKERRAQEQYRIKKFLKGFLFYGNTANGFKPYVKPKRKKKTITE